MAGNINIAPRMARRSVVRDIRGNIIDLLDESDGGYIIRKGVIVNQEKYDEIKKKEADRKEAAQAMAKAVTPPPEVVEMRQGHIPNKDINELKEQFSSFKKEVDTKFDAILEAIKSK